MNPWMLAVAAVALAIERIAYAAVWHRPGHFTRACRKVFPALDPVTVLAGLGGVFKIVQGLVFVAWCVVHAGSAVAPARTTTALWVGGSLLVIGQVLNLSVFARLGAAGVFWGLFVIIRYPAPDWIALPLLETLYYAIGSMVEQSPTGGSVIREPAPSARAADRREAEPLR